MVRSVNSGPSSAIDRSGRIVASLELHPADVAELVEPEQLVVDVEIGRDTATRPTLHARGGWLLVHLCQSIAVVAGLVLFRSRRRRAAS
jgi:apolipoprotein N-acyltransferase